MAGYFHLASADIKCQLKLTPRIDITASDTSIVHDHTKSQQELDGMGTDTKSPYGKGVRTHVGGLMSGEVGISQKIRIMEETYPTLNAGCLYVDSVSVQINIKPTIYIARDFAKGGCMYNAIMEHEKKHIEVDREIVNRYKTRIRRGLEESFRRIGYGQGPFTKGRLPAEKKRIQEYAQSIVQGYSEQMSEERRRLQQAVDTLEEYNRVNAKCPGRS